MQRAHADGSLQLASALSDATKTLALPRVRREARRLPFFKTQLATSAAATASSTTVGEVNGWTPAPSGGLFSLPGLGRSKERAALEAALVGAQLADVFADAEWEVEEVLDATVGRVVAEVLAPYCGEPLVPAGGR